MRIRVDVHKQDLVSVELMPAWWRRLLGDRAKDGFAVAIRGHAGSRLWCWDRSGRDVDGGAERTPIADAIELELRRLRAERP